MIDVDGTLKVFDELAEANKRDNKLKNMLVEALSIEAETGVDMRESIELLVNEIKLSKYEQVKYYEGIIYHKDDIIKGLKMRA